MRELKKGSLGLLVMRLLHERPSYGYELCERLRERTDGTLSFEDGAMYPLLHAFERDGLAEGYWEAEGATDDAERRGPRRRYYRLTARGVAALREASLEWLSFARAVGQVLDGPAVLGKEGE